MKKVEKKKFGEISIQNEDNSLKSKKEFLDEMKELYDAIAEQFEEQEDSEKDPFSDMTYFSVITDPECAISVETTLETFDFTERTIYLTEEIKPETAVSVFEVIRFWNKVDTEDEVPVEEREPIKIYINTPGGDLDGVLSIISAIQASVTPVYTYNIGTAYSGGFFICIAGHKRFALSHTSFMFHEGAAVDGGDAHKFFQHVDFYRYQLTRLKKHVLDNTKITSDIYEEHRKDDWFMDQDDAKKFGVIDEIIEKL